MELSEFQEPNWLLPFEALDIGESFFIPTLQPANMIYVIETRSKVAGVKIKSFTTTKDGYLGVRVWRVR